MIFELGHGNSVKGALHKCQTSPKVCERDSKSWFILQARQSPPQLYIGAG